VGFIPATHVFLTSSSLNDQKIRNTDADTQKSTTKAVQNHQWNENLNDGYVNEVYTEKDETENEATRSNNKF
jgi:hypothetical protein